MKITQARVKELFDYNPETGECIRKAMPNRASAAKRLIGKPAGYMSNQGYYNVKVDGRCYRLHRLIWLWVYGYLPEGDLDHINRIRSDNRISNLRESSRSCNVFNSKKRSDSSAAVRGVCERKEVILGMRYIAYVGIQGRMAVQLRTNDFTEAVAHRLAAEQCLGVSSADGIETEAAAHMSRYLESCV